MKTKSDFDEFMSSTDQTRSGPPAALDEKITSRIHALLNPSAWLVFSKLSLIHLFSATLTLSVCPQFGFRIFGSGHGLSHIFMRFGTYGCSLACGSLFLGSTLLLATVFLRVDEFRVLSKNILTQAAALALLSLSFFLMMDVQFVIGATIAWFIGSLFGAWVIGKIGGLLRLHIAK